MKEKFNIVYISKAFALLMIGIGIADLTQPQSFKEAMDSLKMPHYILFILGFFKISGGLAVLILKNSRIREWAYGGFFIWSSGAIACHLFSGHSFGEILPIMSLSVFLITSYVIDGRFCQKSGDKTDGILL